MLSRSPNRYASVDKLEAPALLPIGVLNFEKEYSSRSCSFCEGLSREKEFNLIHIDSLLFYYFKFGNTNYRSPYCPISGSWTSGQLARTTKPSW